LTARRVLAGATIVDDQMVELPGVLRVGQIGFAEHYGGTVVVGVDEKRPLLVKVEAIGRAFDDEGRRAHGRPVDRRSAGDEFETGRSVVRVVDDERRCDPIAAARQDQGEIAGECRIHGGLQRRIALGVDLVCLGSAIGRKRGCRRQCHDREKHGTNSYINHVHLPHSARIDIPVLVLF
jgi:hypothetical protein